MNKGGTRCLDFVMIVSVDPSSGYGGERGGKSPYYRTKGDGLGNTTGGARVRYRHGVHGYCPVGTESRRFERASGKVDGGTGNGNGEGSSGTSREVTSRILRPVSYTHLTLPTKA